MPRFTKESDDRTITVETSVPLEAAELRANGFTEYKDETAAFSDGGELTPGLTAVTNDTGRPETVKTASKSTK